MLGSPFFVVAIFWLGWTGQYPSISWYIPAISTIPLGTGISLISMSFLVRCLSTASGPDLITDPHRVTWSTPICESLFLVNPINESCLIIPQRVQMFINIADVHSLPFITNSFHYIQLEVSWACTLIGLTGLLFAPSPFLFYKYGPRIRAHSNFAPCIVCLTSFLVDSYAYISICRI